MCLFAHHPSLHRIRRVTSRPPLDNTQALDPVFTPGQSTPTKYIIANFPQGRSSHPAGAMPSWSPAALLQPGRRNTSIDDARNFMPNQSRTWHQPTPEDRANSENGNTVVFEFASSNATPVSTPPSGDSPAPGLPMPNGVGSWIERMNNVQTRSAIPQAKRRRVDEGGDSPNGNNVSVRGSGSTLGDYVRERRREANGVSTLSASASTVDLTDGKIPLAHINFDILADFRSQRRLFIGS